MTIKVKITNCDTREACIINARECGMNPPMLSDTQGPRQRIKPGETLELWVHSQQYIVVMEGDTPEWGELSREEVRKIIGPEPGCETPGHQPGCHYGPNSPCICGVTSPSGDEKHG